MESDVQLLLQYARYGDESAFAGVVARHADLVYSAALRQVTSTDAARDVAQSVFIDLARKARILAEKFPSDASLVGWLYRSTRFAALTALRGQRRRVAVEKNAMNNLEPANELPESSIDWERVQPLLDELMSSLSDHDRDALLLRFFKKQDFRAVGVALGISDDAAQKRVSRALEKLRALLHRRGITASASALSVAISANAVEALPPGFAGALSGAAVASGAVYSVVVTSTKLIAMTTLQKAVAGAVLAVVVGTGLHQARRAHSLNDQLQGLMQQQAPLADTNRKLQEQIDENALQFAALREENERLKGSSTELVRLRGEVGRLRRESESQTKADGADPTDIAARAWVGRVKALKERFQQWPGRKTPELELLTEQNWLDAAAAHQLDSEEDTRRAMSELRWNGMSKFSDAVNQALKQFMASNNQAFPAEPSDLSPFLDSTASACLAGWDVAKAGWVHPPQPNAGSSKNAAVWALVEKGSFTPEGIPIRDGSYVADPEYDMTMVIYNGGSYGYGPDKHRKRTASQ
jgi:RNA polymerase sigma factor (sigma-70 family)